MGNGAYIGHRCYLVVTEEREVGLTLRGGVASRLEVGERTFIGEGNNIRAAGGTIKIGKDCLIAQNVSLVASNHVYISATLTTESGWDADRLVVRGRCSGGARAEGDHDQHV